MTAYGQPSAPTQPPQHPMPSRRISVSNQIKLLISGAASSGSRYKAFSIQDVAGRAHISPGQARYSTRFFVAAGLWESMGNGVFRTTEQGTAFGAAWDSSREQARAVLARVFAAMWFHETLCRELEHGPTPVEKLEQALLIDGGGHEQHIRLVKVLIEWLSVGLLIEQTTDGMIMPGPRLPISSARKEQAGASGADAAAEADAAQTASDAWEEQQMADSSSTRTPGGHTAPEPAATTFLIKLTVEALGQLAPDRIPEFMRDLGQLAQGGPDSVLHCRAAE